MCVERGKRSRQAGTRYADSTFKRCYARRSARALEHQGYTTEGTVIFW